MRSGRFERLKYWVSAPTRWFVSGGVGASLASGVNWVGETILPYIPTGKWTTALKGTNYALTGLTFLVTTKIAKKKFDQSNRKTAELETEVLKLAKDHKAVLTNANELKRALNEAQDHIDELISVKDKYSKAPLHDRVHEIFQSVAGDPLKEIEKQQIPESRLAKIRAWMSKPKRWLLSSSIGANLASGMHYCFNLFIGDTDKTVDVLSVANFAVSGATWGGTAYLANQKLIMDIDHVKALGTTVALIEQENKVLRESIATFRAKIKTHTQALSLLTGNGADEKLDVTTTEGFVKINKDLVEYQTKHETVLDIAEGDHKEEKPGRAKCCKTPVRWVVSLVSGASSASGVYYCTDAAISLGLWFVPGGQWVQVAKGVNYALTGASFIATTKFVAEKKEVNIYEPDGLVKVVERLKEETLDLLAEFIYLNSIVQRQRSQLDTIAREESHQDYDDEDIARLDTLHTFSTAPLMDLKEEAKLLNPPLQAKRERYKTYRLNLVPVEDQKSPEPRQIELPRLIRGVSQDETQATLTVSPSSTPLQRFNFLSTPASRQQELRTALLQDSKGPKGVI